MHSEFKSPPIFFIVGRERSGTTLLQMMLDNHPEIAIPTESPFIKHLYKRHSHRVKWTLKNKQCFFNDLFEEPYINLWGLDKEKVWDVIKDLDESISFADLCKVIYMQSLASKNKEKIKVIGDKNPRYSLFIPELIKIFPEARFIFITRDPRDQVASMMSVNFEKKIISSLAYRWKHFNKTIRSYSSLYPDRFCFVRYEDLVLKPQEKIKELTAFIGLNFNAEMLNSDKRALQYLSNNSLLKKHHSSLLKPIDTDKVYSWKKTMPPNTVKMIDHVTGDLATELGYEVVYKKSLKQSVLSLPGTIYGRLYFSFLTLMDVLPYSVRMYFFKRIIAKNFSFWKEAANKS